MAKLRTLIKQWVRAEFAFRHGPDRHSDRTQQWLLDAEDALREAVTDEPELVPAAQELGLELPKPKKRKSRKPKKRPTMKRKGRGLFQ